MARSPSHQRNAVSEGTAFGLVLLGTSDLPHDKIGLDLGFAGAWRRWPHRAQFPQVSTDLRNGSDGIRVLMRATQSHHTALFYWETQQRGLVVQCRLPDWDPNHPEDLEFARSVVGDEVPPEGWVSLARDLLGRLHVGPPAVRTAEVGGMPE